MFRIAKSFQFSSAHSLPFLPETHKCARVHGHTYTLTVELEGDELHEQYFWIQDYGDLTRVEELVSEIDHRNLNDLYPVTTAEWLAREFYGELVAFYPELVAVRLSESPHSWAEYRP